MQRQHAHKWIPALPHFNLRYQFAGVSNLNSYNHQRLCDFMSFFQSYTWNTLIIQKGPPIHLYTYTYWHEINVLDLQLLNLFQVQLAPAHKCCRYHFVTSLGEYVFVSCALAKFPHTLQHCALILSTLSTAW